MFEHLDGYVGQKEGVLFLKHLSDCANAGNCGAGRNRRSVRLAVERYNLELVRVSSEGPEVGSVKFARAGQDTAQTAQDGVYRGLLRNRNGGVEQRTITTVRCRLRGNRSA